MPDDALQPEPEHHRIGVILCRCGGQVSGKLDITTLAQQSAGMPGVVYSACEDYPCSPDGHEYLRACIQEHNLERVLVAGCAPRLVEKLFQQAVRPAGLRSSDLSVVDIREAAAYAHPGDPEGALRKALSAVEMGVIHLDYSRAAVPHSAPITRSALVLGGDLSAMTLALALADQGVPVTLAEPGDRIGALHPGSSKDLEPLTRQRMDTVLAHPGIQVMLNTRLVSLGGHPGRYEAWLRQRGQTNTVTAGVLVVANRGLPKPLGAERWIDRSRVKSQLEFEQELEQACSSGSLGLKQVVFFLCAEESQLQHCSRVCCSAGFRQALKVRQLNPDANVTILFRELYLGDQGETELAQARAQGVTFFRYRCEAPPVISDATIDVQDLLTGIPIQVPYERVVMSMPLVPDPEMTRLAALLDLPLDEWGFLAEPRVRLRPGRYTDPGIYVLGSTQLPSGTTEATFQAYLTAARALRLLDRDEIQVNTPVAEIDPKLCTGCGSCPLVCPVEAIHLERRDGILSLSEVDALRCIGCGNCAVVCPVKAIEMPGWEHADIPAQISAALDPDRFAPGEPRILVMACEWSAYAAAEAAGHRHVAYPACARLMRMNCSARFDPYHVLWALLNGADGVLLGACQPGECHYGMGNLYARERLSMLQDELTYHGIDPRRLRLEYFRVDEGEKFAQAVNRFVHDLHIHRVIPESVTERELAR